MKKIVGIFKDKNIVFKELKRILLSELGIRKRYEVFEGVDIKNRFYLVFKVERKSRFLSKNAEDLIDIYHKVSKEKEHSFRYVCVLFLTPFCSKAKDILLSKDFKVIDATL
ncbi:hypothetical protein [Nitrosophilus labii]|uniref:hypothetical protein n=1 Tax=Nitrosophilus labii TaxID=2706014 RepID=UPI001656D3FA|nr:hypothetical protein [Nitrosophilus labii]